MPLYDFKCENCGHVENDSFCHMMIDSIECPKCKKDMRKLISSCSHIHAKVFPSDGVFLEHVSATGQTFRSTKEMRTYEREHDVELGYLL